MPYTKDVIDNQVTLNHYPKNIKLNVHLVLAKRRK